MVCFHSSIQEGEAVIKDSAEEFSFRELFHLFAPCLLRVCWKVGLGQEENRKT